MLNYYKQLAKNHPYWHVIFILSIASLVGILIEYLINKNFIGSGIYASVLLGIIEIARVKKKKHHHNW